MLEDRPHLGVGHGVGDGDGVGRDVDGGAGDGQHTGAPGCGQALHEHPLVGEDAQLVAGDHVEAVQLGVEERRRPGAGHHGPRPDGLDVAHRPGELAVDLGVDQLAHPLGGLFVHHRIPDGAAVLQPVEVDRAVRVQRVQVVGAAVVLVHQTAAAVADDEGRVAAGAVGDAGLDVDGDAQIAVQGDLLAVDRAHDVGEAETAQDALELAGGKARDEHRGVAAHMVRQPFLVEVIGVDVRHVEVVGAFHPLEQVGGQLVVTREDEPRAEERRREPGIAEDRTELGLDEDAGVADGGGAHDYDGSGRPAGSTGGSGDGRVGVLLAGA